MTTLAPTGAPPRTSTFARTPVLAIAAAVALVLGVASARGTYFFDELYFLMAGRDHLAWGYFDQPPLVPALAALTDALAPGSLLVFRLPATLAAAAMVVLAAAIARELGGSRGAQVLAAVATAASGLAVLCHWLATYPIDALWWTAIVWLVVRWTRVRDDRLLLVAGIVTGLSLNTKFLVPALWVGILLGVAAFGPRELLRRPALWGGGLVAVAMTLPTLAWQAVNGWPYTQMADVVRAESGGPLGLLAGTALTFTPLALALAVIGIVRTRSRFLAVAAVVVVVAVVLAGGRMFYLLSLLPALSALGAVEVATWRRARIARIALGTLAIAVSTFFAATSIPLPGIETVPGLPAQTVRAAEQAMVPVAAAGRAAWEGVPAEDRGHTGVVAQIYPVAAAVEHEGVPTWSPHRGYGYFDPPPASVTEILWVGFEGPAPALQGAFAQCTQRPTGADLQVWMCTGLRDDWRKVWPTLRTH